jgi:integrase
VTAFITRRTLPPGKSGRTKPEPRYVVRFRLGGRAYPIEHGGSFPTMSEARTRRDFIAGELAAGRNPADALRAIVEAPARRTLTEWAKQYQASRIDLADETTKSLGSHLRRILPIFGEWEPEAISWGDVQEWVAAMAAELKPGSVKKYVVTLRQLLDFAGVDPNPARDKRVKLPAIVVEEPQPPTAKQLLAMLDAVPRRWVLPLITIEQTAMAVGETAGLAWGDVDVAESRFRLRRRTVKGAIGSRARWVQVPEWLMDEIVATCPLEDRTAERRVFPGFTPDAAKNAMARACKDAGIPHFHPHDLRHRRITIWHHDGVPARVLAERAGHSRPSMSLDVYSHALPPGEAAAGELLTRLRV